jgi:adenine-specific DNA methylase
VNNKGQFNTPIGRYANPIICDERNIREIHDYLADKNNKIEILNESYETAIKKAKDGDIIYIDPPYDYQDDDGFTKYQINGFSFDDFVKLKDECDAAINRGAFVIMSNNATAKVLDLFQQDPRYKIFYDFNEFSTLRSINCKGSERRTGKEVIFWGMDGKIPFPQANDMSKVIKLLMSDELVLRDKSAAMQAIDVKTERQVAYYMSALLFLGYIKHDKKFTTHASQIRVSVELIKKDIYNQLMNNNIFSKQYEKYKSFHEVDIDEVRDILTRNASLSESTIRRRGSTIRAWVEWMYEFDRESNNIFNI